MSHQITFATQSEPWPTRVASLLFLVPGTAAVVIGILTLLSLSWITTWANGLLLIGTGSVWTLAGVGLIRFQRWLTVDADKKQVVRGTRTLFQHPAERFPLAAFLGVEVQQATAGDHIFYVAALRWDPHQRPGRIDEDAMWLHAYETVDEARTAANAVASLTGMKIADRTKV